MLLCGQGGATGCDWLTVPGALTIHSRSGKPCLEGPAALMHDASRASALS